MDHEAPFPRCLVQLCHHRVDSKNNATLLLDLTSPSYRYLMMLVNNVKTVSMEINDPLPDGAN